MESIALIRNIDLAPDAPATMADLLKAAAAAKAKDPKVTVPLDQSVGKTGNAYYTYPWLSAYGGGIFAMKDNGDYDPAKVIINSAESLKGAAQLEKMGKDKVLSTNVGDDNAESIFTGGKSAFFITGPWSVPNIKKAGINYAISSLPSLDGGDAMQPFLGVQLFYVSAKAKNAALAQEFVTNYVTTKDFQVAFFAAGGRPPALTEAYDEVAAKDAEVQAWYEAGKDGKPMPNIPAMNSVWGPLGQAASDVIAGKAGAKERFDAAQKEIVAKISLRLTSPRWSSPGERPPHSTATRYPLNPVLRSDAAAADPIRANRCAHPRETCMAAVPSSLQPIDLRKANTPWWALAAKWGLLGLVLLFGAFLIQRLLTQGYWLAVVGAADVYQDNGTAAPCR